MFSKAPDERVERRPFGHRRRDAAVTIASKLTSATAKTVVGTLLAVALLALFFRGTDFRSIGASLAAARPELLALAILTMLMTYAIRAFRWRVLLSPLGNASLWNCFVTTVVGFMLNFLVPSGRVGEVARPYLLARKEGFLASSAFATIFVERILDLVAVAVLLGLWLMMASRPDMSAEALTGLKIGGWLGMIAAVAAIGVLWIFARHPQTAPLVTARVVFFLPRRWREKLVSFSETFARGLAVVAHGRAFLAAIGLSIAVWLSIALGFWLGARSLGVSFPYQDTFPVIGFLTLGVLVPTPGAVGGYHYMCALALTTLFGTEDSAAKAVALTNHAIAFLPVTILGILLLPPSGMSFSDIKKIGSSGPGDSKS